MYVCIYVLLNTWMHAHTPTKYKNVSADMSSGLLQMFGELGNLHGTSNYVLYWNHGGRLFWFRLLWTGTNVKYSCTSLACSEDWTCNLQMIIFLVAHGTNAYNRYAICPAGLFRVIYSPIWIIFFPATFILSDFIHIYFHTVFSEKTNTKYILT